ncbi:hypothetical protein EDB89DRAFT_2064873 [Lactarius sanguifluus]|nr:hypothetical protein EDB89DRAFT_2064873 [Lactarius sanguifluus]
MPHSAVSLSSPFSPFDGVIEHVFSFVRSPGTRETPLGQSIAHSPPSVDCSAQGRSHESDSITVNIVPLSGVRRFDDSNDGRGEIDEVGQSLSLSDPPAALLEIFDPDQNVALMYDPPDSSPQALFPPTWMASGTYLEVPINLSPILFICSAKSLVSIASPSLDRLAHVQLTEPALLQTITQYTCEVGVRSLEHAISKIVCFEAMPRPSDMVVKRGKDGDAGYNPVALAVDQAKILGAVAYVGDDREREAWRGIV